MDLLGAVFCGMPIGEMRVVETIVSDTKMSVGKGASTNVEFFDRMRLVALFGKGASYLSYSNSQTKNDLFLKLNVGSDEAVIDMELKANVSGVGVKTALSLRSEEVVSAVNHWRGSWNRDLGIQSRVRKLGEGPDSGKE